MHEYNNRVLRAIFQRTELLFTGKNYIVSRTDLKSTGKESRGQNCSMHDRAVVQRRKLKFRGQSCRLEGRTIVQRTVLQSKGQNCSLENRTVDRRCRLPLKVMTRQYRRAYSLLNSQPDPPPPFMAARLRGGKLQWRGGKVVGNTSVRRHCTPPPSHPTRTSNPKHKKLGCTVYSAQCKPHFPGGGGGLSQAIIPSPGFGEI